MESDETQEVVISTAFRKEKLTYSNLWFLISLFLTVGLIIYSIINYHLLPDQIPMQYSFSGEVTRSAEKSYLSILMVPAFQFFLIGVFIFSNSMIQLAKQQIDQSNPKLSLKRNSTFPETLVPISHHHREWHHCITYICPDSDVPSSQ